MNEIIREYTFRSLMVQRNIFLSLTFGLLLLVLVFSVLVFKRTERVIIVPATVEKEFWVEGEMVSPSYLEQMGCFLGDLLLTRSSHSSDMQLAILMRHVDPAFSVALQPKLQAELEKLQKDNASYIFFKTNVLVEPHTTSVVLKGDRTLFLGDKILSRAKESYRLGFSNFGGRLLLSSVERIESDT